jgi:hypothetical protein
VIDDADLRTLVVVLSATQFTRRVAASPGFAVRAAEGFRDLCDAARPTFGFFQTIPTDDIARFLGDLSDEIHGLDLDRLATFDFRLWYVNREAAGLVRTGRLVRRATELPSAHGTVFRAG